MPGNLALILHAHLPFVRHPEHEHFLEEDWFFEALTESYIPLLFMMQQLERDGVPFKFTMSITPTLCAMLQDPLLRTRYLRYLENAIELSQREIAAHMGVAESTVEKHLIKALRGVMSELQQAGCEVAPPAQRGYGFRREGK